MSEIHDFGLPVPFSRAEGSLPFVSCANADIVISRSDIKLSEQRVPLKFLGNVFNVRKWILVSDRPVVDGSVVLYWAVRPILLFDTEGTGSVWRFGWFNISFGELFFRPFMHKLGLRGAEGIYFTLKGVGGVQFEVDGVVVLPP